MKTQVTRTPNGYRLGNLEATGLPPRQSQVLLAIASGLTQQQAADLLGCKSPSIRQGVSALLFKLHAHNAVHLVACAFARGNLHLVKTLAVLVVAMHACLAPYTTSTGDDFPRPRMRQSVRIRRLDELQPHNQKA